MSGDESEGIEVSYRSNGRLGRKALAVGIFIGLLLAPVLGFAGYGAYAWMSRSGPGGPSSGYVKIIWQFGHAVNRDNKGDSLRPSATKSVSDRFHFDVILPKDIPVPRPKPAELIALQGPTIDVQPAFSRDKPLNCRWSKHRDLPKFMLECTTQEIDTRPIRR